MRARVLLPLLLLAGGVPAQDAPELERSERTETLPLATRDLLDPDPIAHLGYGTLEDAFVDVGGGVHVSVLSGNLVARIEPIPRPDLPPRVRMALTYNHAEPEGAPDLAPGWTHTFARSVVAGAWGDRVLVDADGFRDAFWAGPPPTAEELDSVTRDVIAAWRADTAPADRRRLGGVRALEELLVSDPSTLGAMRLRYLGAPDGTAQGTFRSSARGVRLLDVTREGATLRLPDGGSETFDLYGRLATIEPPGAPPWSVVRDNGALSAVTSGGLTAWTVETDSRFRVQKMIDITGGMVRLEYAGSSLVLVESASGTWSAHYDGRTRLDRLETPDGTVRVEYDDSTGRVAAVSGPRGDFSLRAELEDAGLAVDVDGLPGGTWRTTWDAERRLRIIQQGARREEVRFAERAALPVRVDGVAGTLELAWDPESGRPARASRDGREVRWERDAGGLVGLVEPGGRGVAESDGLRLLGWADPAGRRTRLERNDGGAITAVRSDAGDRLLRRAESGRLAGVSALEGVEVLLPSPELGTAQLRMDGASAGVRRDPLGRLVGYDGPTGRAVRLRRQNGRVVEVRDDRSALGLRFEDGRLAGWTGPEGDRVIRRDGDGAPVALLEGATPRWELRRDAAGQPDRLLLDGVEARVDMAPATPVAWQRPGGAWTRLERRPDGAVVAWSDDGLGEVRLDLDRAGRAVGVVRGGGRWTVARDRSGAVQRVADPAGGVDLTLDGAGHAEAAAASWGQSWTLARDSSGRLVAIEGRDGAFGLELDRSGRPERLVVPGGADAELTFDVRGRWSGLDLPAGDVRVTWGLLGPTRIGELGWRTDAAGALVGWGAKEGGELRWFADHDTDGRVRVVRSPYSERAVRRDGAGRPTLVGDAELTWGPWGLQEVAGPRAVRLERDAAGRVRAWTVGGRELAVERDRDGDARVVDGLVLERDLAGRIVAAADWRATRDGAGRVLETGAGAFTWTDVEREGDDLLAQALDVQTGEEFVRATSGSWTLRRGGMQVVWTPDRGGVLDAGARFHGLPDEAHEALGPLADGGEPVAVGDAARAARWWSGRQAGINELAWLPEALPEAVAAWRMGRDRARAAGLPEDVRAADVGALLPPVPGATALIPGPAGARRVTATEALVVSGDLPLEALLWSAGGPLEVWQLDLPGAAELAAMRGRLAAPTLPPGSGIGVAEVEGGAAGVVTERGRAWTQGRSWDVRPAVAGLPPGTADVLPGTPGWTTALGSTPADGRATRLDALSSDPLGLHEEASARSRADGLLLALHALASDTPTALDGLLSDAARHEAWLLELPSGVRVVVDGRGEVLSLDTGGRLRSSQVGAVLAWTGEQLLAPTVDGATLVSGDDDSPWQPRWLPERGPWPESRWGLAPAHPLAPLDGRGRVEIEVGGSAP